MLTVTTSEFGRRITRMAATEPTTVTGRTCLYLRKGRQSGVIGKVPDLNQDTWRLQYDYRQVYASILRDWMLVDEAVINTMCSSRILSMDRRRRHR
ncbi:MAG: hypothetical protein WDO15_17480 [Bacteroidota bacterium]